MNTKLYVDNLGDATTESELIELFSAYGNVAEVNIVVDRTSHKPRGFGFVTMATSEGARAAVQSLNGKVIGTQGIIVTEARPPDRRAARPNAGRSLRRGSNHLI